MRVHIFYVLLPIGSIASTELISHDMDQISLQNRELSTSSPSVCADNDAYRSPINRFFGCEIHSAKNCDCYTFQNLMTSDELQDLFDSCPQTCGVPCGYKVPVPTVSPSAHPIEECKDDESYTSPIFKDSGCEVQRDSGCDCYTFKHLMTAEELQDLFDKCPETCGVPCNFQLPSPSAVPSSYKSIVPSSTPSAHPSECVDDVDFQNPFSPEFGCSFFKHAVYDCYSWEGALSEAQISDLLASCPVSCGIPCR